MLVSHFYLNLESLTVNDAAISLKPPPPNTLTVKDAAISFEGLFVYRYLNVDR